MANEKQLIDLWSVNMNEVDTSDCTDVEDILSAVISYLSELHTVDAVEVVHGRWIEHVEIGAMNNHYECSACHWKTPSFTIARDSNFCPNCGAKMDGDGNA